MLDLFWVPNWLDSEVGDLGPEGLDLDQLLRVEGVELVVVLLNKMGGTQKM